MRRSVSLILVLSAAVHVGAAPGPKPKAGTIEATLLGAWVAVEWEEKGEPADLKKLQKEIRMALVGEGTFRVSEAGGDPEQFQFTIRRQEGAGSLYELNLHKGGEKMNHALLQLHDNETFTLVVHHRFEPNQEADRPTEITSKNNEKKDPDGLWNPHLFKFKRLAKGQKPGDVIEVYWKAKK